MQRLYPEKPASDITRAANGATRLGFQPWATPSHAQSPTFKPYQHDGSEEPLPETEIEISYSKFFKDGLGFRDDEYVWFAANSVRFGGGKDGEVCFSQWDEGYRVGTLSESGNKVNSHSGQGFTRHGTYFSINPLRTGKSRTVDNVSRYVYAMFESDKISKEEQLAIYRKTKLPIAALIDSGGKSVHAIVRIDALDLAEYNQRTEMVKQLLGPDFDNTQDAVRFSRLPNSRRGESRQRLIESSSGPGTWQEFERSAIDDGFPDFEDADAGTETEPELEPEIIQGMYRRGEKMILGAPSKGKKTFALINLYVAVSNEKEWLGRQCNQGKALYVNLELSEKGFKRRLRAVKEAMGVASVNGSKAWHLRGKNGDIALLADAIIRRAKPGEFDLVIIDPAYKSLGNRDENKAGDIADFLNHVERITTETGSAVILAHHFPKGSAAERQARDKTSGSGVWMRDPDLALNFTPQKKSDNDPEPDYTRFTVEAVPREYPDIPDFVVEFKFPLFAVDGSGDPKATRKKAGPKQKYSAVQIAELVGDGPMAHKDILEKAKNAYGASKGTINARLKEAEDAGMMKKDNDGFWISDPEVIAKHKESSAQPTFRVKKELSPELSNNSLVGIPD
jgi:RecA-family ATPase